MCITPNFIWVEQGPQWVKVPRPCKMCWQCVQNRINDYVARGICEASVSDWTCTVTLTYGPRTDLAEMVINPVHFQKFIRSMRDRHHKIRYFAAAEYGELKGRVHFHVILFGKGKKPDWPQGQRYHDQVWPHGHMFADWGTDYRALKYAMKYLDKGKASDTWFSVSKKPPLGAEFFVKKASEMVRLGVFPTGFHYQPPGAIKGKSFLMSGATRRDYLLSIYDNWQGTLDFFKLEPIVSETLFKCLFHRKVKELQASEKLAGLDEACEALKIELARKAPDQAAIDRLEADFYPIMFREVVIFGQKEENRPSRRRSRSDGQDTFEARRRLFETHQKNHNRHKIQDGPSTV